MKITNECNMELMSRYEDNHFDLAIVDPPYGTKYTKIKNWDFIPSKKYFKELFRVSKNQIIWGWELFWKIFFRCNYLPDNLG